MKNKKQGLIKVFLTVVIFSAILFAISTKTVLAADAFNYTLLESFPGFFNKGDTMTDFPVLILSIYKFGIWTVGIAGMFMLVIGGFMYMASAGNTSTAGSARKIISDALFGIVAALGAYLFMYVINPDLTRINIDFTTVDLETEGTPMGPAGVCKALDSGDCSAANLTSVFGANATQASSICNGESSGKSIPSGVDICIGNGAGFQPATGKSATAPSNDAASIGLFQINISVHNVDGLPCRNAFNREYTAAIGKDKTKCWVINRSLYDQCVAAAKVPSKNIAVAKKIFSDSKNSWRQWGANKRSKCFFP